MVNELTNEEKFALIEHCKQDPRFFIENVLGWQPWKKQREIIEAFKAHKRITIKSGHGMGKTKLMAALAINFLFTRPKSKVITTAPSWILVQNVLWGEIRSQYKNATIPLGGTCLETAIKTLDDAHFAIGISSDEPERIHGFHGESVLVIVDEASGVQDNMLDALEGLLTQEDSKLVYIGNPTNTNNKFYRSFYDPEYSSLFHKITISCFESPNVIMQREVIPGLTSYHWVEEMKTQYGEKSGIYLSRVLGDFPLESEDQLIPTKCIEDAQKRDLEPHYRDPLVLTIDVARYGEDENVFLLRRGNKEVHKERTSGKSLNETIGKAIILINQFEPDLTIVDDIGVGGGVTDALGKKYYVMGFTGNGKPNDDLFLNLRAEYYWKLKNKFVDGKLSIIKDGDMTAELSTVMVDYGDGSGRIKIKSKKSMKRSPNLADALMMSEYGLDQLNFTEIKHLPTVWYNGMNTTSVSGNKSNKQWRSSRTGY